MITICCEPIRASNISKKSVEFAKMLIHGNAWMTHRLELRQLSIAKLCQLFQLQGSEKAPNRKPKNDPASLDNKGSNTAEETAKGHGRNGADAYQGTHIVEVEHPNGDTCPAEACDGRLYLPLMSFRLLYYRFFHSRIQKRHVIVILLHVFFESWNKKIESPKISKTH